MKILSLEDIKLKYGLNDGKSLNDNTPNHKVESYKISENEKELSAEEFDKAKTRVLKYVTYKKRTENEIRVKFAKDIDTNLLEDVIEELKFNRIYK